jgi:hypothetical protein
MTDEQMEDLVARIIQRLRPPVLVMVTAAAATAGNPPAAGGLRRSAAPGAGRGSADRRSGRRSVKRCRRRGRQDAAVGLHGGRCCRFSTIRWRRSAERHLRNPQARAHEALLAGLPVLALRYHCDPPAS